MKKVHFETETDGFYGAYWKTKNKSYAAMILMLKGKLLLIGASDDCLWDTVKYINRMEERLKK